eukprot:7957881-Pyramimonas_sp.AAC.1
MLLDGPRSMIQDAPRWSRMPVDLYCLTVPGHGEGPKSTEEHTPAPFPSRRFFLHGDDGRRCGEVSQGEHLSCGCHDNGHLNSPIITSGTYLATRFLSISRLPQHLRHCPQTTRPTQG